MKKLWISLFILAVLLALGTFAWRWNAARTTAPLTSSSNTAVRAAAYSASILSQGALQAQAMLSMRIAGLESAQLKIDSASALSASEKSSLDTAIVAEIASTSALKAQINAATSTATLSVEVEEMVNDPVYARIEEQLTRVVL